MKKPVKLTLWILGGILAFVILAVLALPLWIGPVATGVAGAVAPSYTGTPFKMEKFSLNPYTGKLFIGGLNLGNPADCEEKTAFSLDSLSVDVEVSSLFTQKIHVRDITIESPYVSYVTGKNGTNNFEQILANVQSKLGSKEKNAEEKPEEAKSQKKVVIDRLCINGTKVKFLALPAMPIPLPTLTGIGAESESGASFEEVGKTVLDQATSKMSGLGGLLGGLGGDAASKTTEVVGKATDAAKEVAGKTADAAKETAAKATESVKDVGKAVGDVASKAAEGAKETAAKATESVKDAGKAVGDATSKAAEGAKDALKKLNPFGK